MSCSLGTGIVMQLNKHHASIMTNTGEFLNLKLSKNPPKLGEIYTGEVVKNIPFHKYAITAATLTFLVLFSSTAYAYYTPVTSVVINTNPSIKLDLNKWNRIIKSTPLNEDGKKVLSELKVQNKSLNDGLDSIVIQAKKDNFINEEFTKSGKEVSINIESSKPVTDFDISKFENNAKSSDINLNITTSSNNKTNDNTHNSAPQNSKSQNYEKNNKLKDNNNMQKPGPKQNNNNNNNIDKNNSNKLNDKSKNSYNGSSTIEMNKSIQESDKNKKENHENNGNGKEKNKNLNNKD